MNEQLILGDCASPRAPVLMVHVRAWSIVFSGPSRVPSSEPEPRVSDCSLWSAGPGVEGGQDLKWSSGGWGRPAGGCGGPGESQGGPTGLHQPQEGRCSHSGTQSSQHAEQGGVGRVWRACVRVYVGMWLLCPLMTGAPVASSSDTCGSG